MVLVGAGRLGWESWAALRLRCREFRSLDENPAVLSAATMESGKALSGLMMSVGMVFFWVWVWC